MRFRSRFSTKLVILIAIVFLIPVLTSILMLASSSRSSIERFDALMTREPSVQRDALGQIVPGAADVEDPARVIGFLRDYEERRSVGLMVGLIVTAVVLAAVVILISLMVLRRGMFSLRELSQAAARVGEGNFDIALKPRSRDEFARLTEAFGTMTRRLRETVVLRDFFNQVVESMPAAVFTVDRDDLVTTWNRQAAKLTGLSPADTIMHKAEGIRDVIGSIPDFEDLPYFGRETVIRPRAGGQRIVSKGADLFYDRSGNPAGVISTFVDISNLKKLERDLIVAKERAEESSRLRSEFLANMSHEIRTPLNGILGLTDVLRDGEADEERRETLTSIRQCGKNLLHLINEILDLSKIEAGKMVLNPTIVGTSDLLKEATATIDVGCNRKGLGFTTKISDDVPKAMEVDRRKVVQILVNLLGNSLKFTEKGTIALELAPYAGERRGNLIFTVTDTGIGIPAEKMEQIFESFTQAEAHLTRSGEGTGLGLAISRKLVELMGGELWVESEVGKGSTFSFTITIDLS